MTHAEAIRTYFRCYRDRDKETLRSLLAPKFRHVSPFGAYDDRDRMIEEIWPSVGTVHAVDIEIFGTGPDYMVRYQHSDGAPARFSEYFRFDGDRIAEIEVYVGRGVLPSPA